VSSGGEAVFRKRVYAAVRRIPRGRVSTYGQIAAVAGYPRAARAVGRALAVIPAPMARLVPWQRVLNAAGGVSRRDPDAMTLQRELLAREGVELRPSGAVDLRRFGWAPPGAATRTRRTSRPDRTRPRDFEEALAEELREIRRAAPRSRAARGAGRGAR
jgi:methylated-DNA-protein-cysteine methyltransferase-like protein